MVGMPKKQEQFSAASAPSPASGRREIKLPALLRSAGKQTTSREPRASTVRCAAAPTKERNMVPMKWLSAALLALGSLAAIAETAPPASTAPLTPAAAPAENNTVAAKPAEGPTAHALTAD